MIGFYCARDIGGEFRIASIANCVTSRYRRKISPGRSQREVADRNTVSVFCYGLHERSRLAPHSESFSSSDDLGSIYLVHVYYKGSFDSHSMNVTDGG